MKKLSEIFEGISNLLNEIYSTFLGIYNAYMLMVVVGIGLFLLVRDVPILKKKKLKKESSMAKVLGYFYVVAGVALFILAEIL